MTTYKFIFLLFSLCFQVFVPIFSRAPIIENVLAYTGVTLTILSSLLIFKVHNSKRFVLIIVVVFTVMFLNWIDFFQHLDLPTQVPRLFSLIILYLLIFVNIFVEFNRRGEVTLDFIFGAVSGYFIIGLMGAFISTLVNFYYPESFSFLNQPPNMHEYIYFSFVTATTLGYGDIHPITPQGESVAMFIVIVGQLYLTITIAMIVGRYLANRK